MESIKLTEEQRIIIEPLLKKLKDAEMGLKMACCNMTIAHNEVWDKIKEFFPECEDGTLIPEKWEVIF